MFNFHEVNEELSKSKLKNGVLVIEGPESLTRTIPRVPDGLTPGTYRYEYVRVLPGEKGQDSRQVLASGQFQIQEPQPETVEEAGDDAFSLAERLAAERLADREAFYKNMLTVNLQAQERIEAEREKVWSVMESRLQAMQKIMLEQVKNQPSQTIVQPPSDKREWWESIAEKYGEQLFPVVLQALAKMGAKDVPFTPVSEASP